MVVLLLNHYQARLFETSSHVCNELQLGFGVSDKQRNIPLTYSHGIAPNLAPLWWDPAPALSRPTN